MNPPLRVVEQVEGVDLFAIQDGESTQLIVTLQLPGGEVKDVTKDPSTTYIGPPLSGLSWSTRRSQ
jgi:hypothetical protein